MKEIDIIEALADKEELPSNDDGKAKSYFDVKVDDYWYFPEKTRKSIIDWTDLSIIENEYNYKKHNGLDHNHCVDVY